ncbi:MAG: hypothetical protein ABIT71_04055, partial [Vicinamibacteraceae bacterium]
ARREGLRWPTIGEAARVAAVGGAAFAGTWAVTRFDTSAPLQLTLAVAAAGTAALTVALVLGLLRTWRDAGTGPAMAPAAAAVAGADAASIVDGR